VLGRYCEPDREAETFQPIYRRRTFRAGSISYHHTVREKDPRVEYRTRARGVHEAAALGARSASPDRAAAVATAVAQPQSRKQKASGLRSLADHGHRFGNPVKGTKRQFHGWIISPVKWAKFDCASVHTAPNITECVGRVSRARCCSIFNTS
jgi:hypothetical protein